MGCVNKASREFKDLAAKHDLAANQLELYTHKYWLQTGNETLFPTDVYIQAQMGNTHYQESGKNVRKLWQMRYSSPIECGDIHTLNATKSKAANFFPTSALFSYRNAKGNLVLSVQRPVESTNYSKDSFFDDLDDMNPKDVKTYNLGIKENQSYGIGKVQELFNRFNTDRTSKDLADRVFNIAKDLGINVTFNESLPFGTIGNTKNNNSITYKKSFFERATMDSKKAPILLHEVLHALSMYALSNQTLNWKKPEALEQFRTEMNSLYQDLKNNPILKGERGIVDVNEFVAELANPIFRGKIQEIDKQNKEKKSFWSRVLDAFKSLLGLHTSNSYYQRSMNALDKALNSFDLDTYMRYNGVKNLLRQGYNAKEWEFNVLSDGQLKSKVNDYFDSKVYDEELLSLKNKAIANGTFMKAPNGKATNLTERQWLQVRTKAFKDWFGDWENDSKNASKVVDENGEPLVVYHGQASEFKEFHPNTSARFNRTKENGLQKKFYTTPSKEFASQFALSDDAILAVEVDKMYNQDFGISEIAHNLGITEEKVNQLIQQPVENTESKIYPVFLVIKNPVEIDARRKAIYQLSKEEISKINDSEGAIIKNTLESLNPDVLSYLSVEFSEKILNNPYTTDYIVSYPNQIKSATDNVGTFLVDNNEIYHYDLSKDYISSLSGKDLKNELSLIKQESADYDLVNNIEDEKKHSGKTIPQDFTFNDGVTIKAPFKPNAQQIDALNVMSDFIKSNETSMTLSGYAGTGKTSLMEMIAKKCQKQHKPVMFCATTNKAAAVLNDRVSKAGFKATTLNKTFGISVEVDTNSKTYNARNLVNNLKDVDIIPGTTIIIDEASMINEENYGILNDIAKRLNLKIIYVGDEAQLAPVNEEKISKVFRNGDGKVVTLTQVERTDDNAILKEATDIRNGKPLSGETSFNSKGEGVAYISPKHQDAINEVVEHYIKGLKKDPNYFRILAYTNKAVTSYNNQVRELLGYDSPVPQRGEPMTGYANWGYDWRTKSYRFINSESYKVINTSKPTKVQTRLDNGTPIIMEAIPLTLEDSLGHTDTFNFMDIKSNPQNRQAAMMLANEKKRLWGEARRAFGREAKAEIYAKINALDSFLFVNDNIEDSNHNLLQAKTIDFGYAMTVHKSQGSTFTNVLMDDVDISRAGFNSNSTTDSVDLGVETPINYDNAEITNEEDVDLGDLSGVEVEEQQPNQVANVKQQLEYVGVSRATDTVTIISNNVKKEGSPLHPNKDVKDDTINNNNSRSDNKNNLNNGTEYKATDEFRRVQEAVRKGSQGQQKSVYDGDLSTDQRQRLANVLGRQLRSIDSFIHGSSRTVTNQRKGTSFNIHSEVNPKLFHDMFEVVRYYTQNAELVDLHEDYSKDKCFLTEDGTAGFAVELNGNLVSVFNLGTTKGFLSAIKDLAREAGANHLDAYVSSKENLQRIYEVTLGFHTAATMDYNMEYDHDDIAKNHGNPQVVFMVDHEVAEPKHFDKDSYDAAQQYQLSQLKSNNVPASYEGFITPSEDTIFVFGSNPEGRHGAGAARTAREKFGAIYGQGEGLQGNFYALPTKDLRVKENRGLRSISAKQITENIKKMYDVARQNPSKKFKVAYTNSLKESTLNGYTGAEMIKMFKDAGSIPSNVIFSKNWTDHWDEVKSNSENKEKEEPTVENPSFPEGTTQQVSLPGYEWYNDLYDETPVDAAWKIPYLKELDAQVNLENSPEENQNIINQMDNVLQATSEKEYLQETRDSKKKEVDRNLDEYEKLNKQIDNLLEGKEFDESMAHMSATEVRHTGELIANELSDLITQLQKEKGLAEKWFPTLNTDLDFQTASRKQIVETVDINRLIQRVKGLFDTEITPIEDVDASLQADVILDNWDAIMYLAADVFAMNEGFGIMKDYSRGNFTTTDDSKIDYDNFNDYSRDPDVVAELGGKDEQEAWMIEMKTIDVLNSMSALVRQGLHECYVLDKDGNKVISKWGIAERVNPRETVNSILRWTQGAMSLEEMIQRLSDKQKQNPWLSQLIERLSDKSGKETDFQSQFYGVFQKHFQQYSIVLQEDGKYHSIIVNSHPALTDVMNTITSQYKIGEHPLFGENGKVNRKLLGMKDSTSNDFTLHKALTELQDITKSLNKGETLDDEMSSKATDNIMGATKILGYPVTEEMLSDVVNAESIKTMTEKLGFIVRDLDNVVAKQNRGELKEYNPFKYGTQSNIGGTLRNFLSPITDKMEDTAVNAFYDSGKMYQSYIAPSFMTKLFNKFHQEGQAFEDFILDEYGSSEWFKFNAGDGDISRGWRNEWLRLLARDTNARKVFDHKVELNFNKHNYMRNMSDTEYTLSLLTEYFSENAKMEDDMAPAWYRVPMQSNKPSSEFIKFYSYRGTGYKDSIVLGLHNMFLQELSRIQTVRMRNMNEKDAGFIKNFDTNGRKFNFLPVFNAYLENDATSISKRDILRNEDNTISSDNARFASLLQKKLDGETALTADEEAEFGKLADRIIKQSMENRIQSILENWEANGILEAAKNIKDIYPSDFSEEAATEHVRKQVENFLWNDTFASKNILQLTLSDIAFYKDTEDLQKRLAQLHAPGVRGNIFATDYNGNRVSDGKYRTFILQDFDSFKSNIIANISEVFDRKIANAPEKDKAAMIALKESLVGKDGKYTKINVTDAQGYSSPSSYRKKALIFGKWSREAENIYQKLLKGEYTYTDLQTAFQPLKPFVYSKLTKDMGVDNAPIHSMQVPFQAKNAEYLLIMADAILKGESLSRPNLLRAVYRVMEDSEKFCPTKGIDTVQFESAIKSGLQGKMNIYQFRDLQGGEEAAYTYMMNQIFKDDTDATGNRVYKNYNTDTFVHEASYDDYCLQQEVPEHFKEHSQAHGSQIRMITPSDLDLYTTDEKGNQIDNYYEWTEPDGTHRKVKADEFRKEYEQTIADNIEESIDNLSAELHLNSEDKKERNIALSKILQREILSSPRYGIDLVQACSIDKETGEFRIPKGDPIQAKRIEQLINSIIKNRVNKQKIAGGPIVQVSNFGTSTQLHIRFNDRKGNLMPLEEEYDASKHNGQSYKDYIKEHQGGIAYFEVFAPIWSNELFDKFANPDGTINVDAINETNPELLKMVSYRIPTEDKYSCAPMKVVGFMPREAGDAIMFPYELTEIDDSDFDVDKRYVMRKDIPIKTKRRRDIEEQLFKKASESYAKAHDGKTNNTWVGEQVRMFMDNPQKMKNMDALMKALYKEYQKIAYYTDVPTSGRQYRDNKIIDMTYAVLTNQMTADKILNPGGFDAPKKMGYMVAAYKNPANNGISWNALEGMSIKELKKLSYTDKDLTFADTQVQFYKQNSAAASLIGVFAVNKVAHATLESNDILLDVSEICGDNDFTIANTTFGGRMQIDKKYDQEGTLIGKTLGSLVSASADAVKDPILNLMNINMTTAGMLNTMLRLGMPFNDAALFLSQDIIEKTLNQFNRENLTGYSSLDSIIDKWVNAYREKYNINDNSNINTEPLTKEELVEGLTSNEHDAIDYKVLLAFQKMRKLVDAMRKPTFATRFNSISSAVGPLIVDNLILEHRMQQFLDSNSEDGTHFYTYDGVPVDIDDIFFDHPVLKQFSRTVDIAKSLFSDMPTGSVGFRNLLANLPSDISEKMYNDKKLLDQFSNFYQSYLLIQSGVVNPKNLKDYATKFPKWFMEQNFKEKYSNNALIQAIRMNVAKKTGRPYLQINITGMDEQAKEELRSAWIDLYKEDPKLSKMLFDYSFFRAGIGFSPKTFMALVPTYVKERLKNEKTGASYVDTYRKFPTVVNNLVIDQFIRNNWNNNKLVPIKGGKDSHYNVDVKHGLLTVYRPEEIAELGDTSYIKTKGKNTMYLWHLKGDDVNGNKVFELIKPLGNNGEYLEMSTSEIKTPLSDTVMDSNVSESNDATTIKEEASDLKTESPQETSAEETSNSQVLTKSEQVKNLSDIADLIMIQNTSVGKSITKEEGLKRAENIKKNPRLFGEFLQRIFKHKGLDLNVEEAINEFKKYC